MYLIINNNDTIDPIFAKISPARGYSKIVFI